MMLITENSSRMVLQSSMFNYVFVRRRTASDKLALKAGVDRAVNILYRPRGICKYNNKLQVPDAQYNVNFVVDAFLCFCSSV